LFQKYSELLVGLFSVSCNVDLTRILAAEKAESATERKGTIPFDFSKKAVDVMQTKYASHSLVWELDQIQMCLN